MRAAYYLNLLGKLGVGLRKNWQPRPLWVRRELGVLNPKPSKNFFTLRGLPDNRETNTFMSAIGLQKVCDLNR